MKNGMFERMCKEAQNELASGKSGTSWREVSPNILIMACFGALQDALSRKLTKPLWVAGSALVTGVIWLIIRDVFGIGLGV